jgi:U3 small nucleolar RNA-associated protein 4
MAPIKALDSNGGAVWSMALICPDPENAAQLAIGCEDGFIRLLNIHSGALEYAKTLERHDGRILSLCWDSQANRLIAGSDKSTIRLYDLQTTRCIHRMTVDTLKGEDSIVWAVKALPYDLLSRIHGFHTFLHSALATEPLSRETRSGT